MQRKQWAQNYTNKGITNIYSPARHSYQTAENPRRIPRRFPKFVKFSAKNGIKPMVALYSAVNH